jgi:PAS domain S-box-containing protein
MNLLLVEDSPTDRIVIQSRLVRAFPDVAIFAPEDERSLTEIFNDVICDVVVTDYWLGWSDGLSVLQRARDRWPRVRVIFVTGNGGEEVIATAFKHGLFLYLIKPYDLDQVVDAVGRAFDSRRHEDLSELMAGIVESIPDAVFSLDARNCVTSWNPAAEDLLGYEARTILGKSCEIFIPIETRRETLLLNDQARAGKPSELIETVWIHADGRRIEVAATVVPIRVGGLVSSIAHIGTSIAGGSPACDIDKSGAKVVSIASRKRRTQGCAVQSPDRADDANRA